MSATATTPYRPGPARPIGRHRPRRADRISLAAVLLALATFTAPWVVVRAKGFLLADYFVVASVAVALVVSLRGRRARLRPSAQLPLFAVALITFGAIVGPVLRRTFELGTAVTQALPFVASAAVSIVAVQLVITNRRELRLCAASYVLGVTASALFGMAIGANSMGRIGGLGGHPNHVGLTCMLAGLLALFGRTILPRTVRYACVAVMLVALVQTGSRAALLGLGAGALAGLVVSPLHLGRKARLLAVVGVLAVGFLAMFPQTLQASAFSRLGGDQSAEASDAAREVRLEAALDSIQANPLLGRGLGDARTAHSVPLQLWAGAGAFGVVAIVVLLRFVQIAARRLHRGRSPVGVGLCAGVIGFGVSSIVANQFWDRYIWLYVGMLTVAVSLGSDRDGEGVVAATGPDA